MSEHQQRLEDLKASSKKSLWFVGVAFVGLILVYVASFYDLKRGQPDSFGQFGDFIGGVLNPLVGFLALFGLWKTASMQTEMLKEQIEREQKNREQDRLEAEEKKQNDIFKRDFEAYQKMLDTLIEDNDGVIFYGKTALYLMLRHNHELSDLRDLLDKYDYDEVKNGIFTMRDGVYDSKINVEIINAYLDKKYFDRGLSINMLLPPIFRVMYQILDNQTHSNYKVGNDFNINTYNNIVFFREQLSREELVFLALNVLFGYSDNVNMASYAQKFGLLKHLDVPLLISLVRKEYGEECFGRKVSQNHEVNSQVS